MGGKKLGDSFNSLGVIFTEVGSESLQLRTCFRALIFGA